MGISRSSEDNTALNTMQKEKKKLKTYTVLKFQERKCRWDNVDASSSEGCQDSEPEAVTS